MGLPPYPVNGWANTTVPPFPYASTRKKSELDLRQQMKIMLEGNEYEPRRGHWVLLRRMDHSQRCTCWNQTGQGNLKHLKDDGKYNEPKLNCPICHGEGWIYTDEPHLVRRRLVERPLGLADGQQMTDIGYMTVNYIVFYLQYYVNPKKDDKIIELDLTDCANPVTPWKFKEVYKIAVAEPFRDENGRIEYWRVACKELVT